MKNALPVLILLFAIGIAGCKKSMSTHTTSDAFSTLASKKAFLEQYVNFRRSYEDLHFEIAFMDGGTGIIPGPSEWDIRLLAVIPAEEMDAWVHGLAASDSPDMEWVQHLPKAPVDLGRFVWFADHSRLVGLDRINRMVLYRNQVF
ncbi:hypothetical protein WJU23_18960 [Prosthecobacter sp. SYSU 5D2]|uniref:hypothetical protein n=1 Tax=Prosthecobacter sp. SYSU 5D2 TaxID=3134134 RepID=UPI0031FEB0E8